MNKARWVSATVGAALVVATLVLPAAVTLARRRRNGEAA
jgi:hypothetical protein